MLKQQSSGLTTNTALPLYRVDPLLVGDNDGVRFLFDLAAPRLCYPGGNPANGAVVKDIAGREAGSVVAANGQAIAFAGNGFAFDAINAAGGGYLNIPASVAADLWADQRFLLCCYVRLPTTADWNTSPTSIPFFGFGSTTSGYVNGPDIASVMQLNTSRRIRAARQTAAGGAADLLEFGPAAADYGSVVQLAFWRSTTQQALWLRSANSRTLVTSAAGAANTQNFSAQTGKIGIGPSLSGGPITSNPGVTKWRAYRGFIENLARSGRDPIAVLDADWARVIARGAFS